jgi:flagellar protein FlaG
MSVNSSLEFGSPPSSYREREALTTDSRDSKSASTTTKGENVVSSDRFISEKDVIGEKNEPVKKAEEENSSKSFSDSTIDDKLLVVNNQLSLKSTSLVFEFDDTSEPPIVKVIDKESGDVIREIPPKELREIAKALTDIADNMNRSGGVEQGKQSSGIFIDERF